VHPLARIVERRSTESREEERRRHDHHERGGESGRLQVRDTRSMPTRGATSITALCR
jgi:hypothetical protein